LYPQNAAALTAQVQHQQQLAAQIIKFQQSQNLANMTPQV